jgi:hypothetical protein
MNGHWLATDGKRIATLVMMKLAQSLWHRRTTGMAVSERVDGLS